MGNSSGKHKPKPLLVYPRNKNDTSIFEQVQTHCKSKPDIPSCLCVRDDKSGNTAIVISTQNCHMVLSVLNYFFQATASERCELISDKGTEHILYSIRLPKAKPAGSVDWPVLFIDYMSKHHSNYELKSTSLTVFNEVQQRQILYFLPRMVQIQQQPPPQQVIVVRNNKNNGPNEGGMMEEKQPGDNPPQYAPNHAYQNEPKQQTWQ